MSHFNEQIKVVMRDAAGGDIGQLNLGLIARGELGRPAVHPGAKTFWHMLMPLMSTSTQSYVDLHKITNEEEKYARNYIRKWLPDMGDGLDPPESLVNAILLEWCDGQSCERECNTIHSAEERYRNHVPFDGPFHESFHFMTGATEMTWEAYSCWAANLLERTAIEQIRQSMEENAYLNYREFIHENAVGIKAYLLLDVTNPPPTLFLNDPKAYYSLVQNQSGLMLIKYLRCAACGCVLHETLRLTFSALCFTGLWLLLRALVCSASEQQVARSWCHCMRPPSTCTALDVISQTTSRSLPNK